MTQVAVDWKGRQKQHNIVTHLYGLRCSVVPNSVSPWTFVPQDTHSSSNYWIKKKKKEKKKVLTLFPSGHGDLGWSHTPGAWAPSLQCQGLRELGGRGRSVSPRCSWSASGPSTRALNLQVQESPSAEKPSLLHLKDGGASGLEAL